MNSFQEKRYVYLAGEPTIGELNVGRLQGPTTHDSLRRSSQGYVSIAECNPDGSYLILQNNHRSRDQEMDRWKVIRRVDGAKEIAYELPMNFELKAGQSVKIWAGRPTAKADNDLVSDDITTWGVGRNEITILYSRTGQERATLVKSERK